MVERALSMGEVEGSMPSFSNDKFRFLVSYKFWPEQCGLACHGLSYT